MPELKFYDLKNRKAFVSDKYILLIKKNPKTKKDVFMAKAKSPKKNDAYRIISKELYEKIKKLKH